jgi:hypothetical protein
VSDEKPQKPSSQIRVIGPVDPKEFQYAWQVVASFQAGKMPGVETPAGKVVPLADDIQIRVLDNSILRVLMAVRTAVQADPEKTLTISLRMLGLMRLVQGKALDRFILRKGSQTLLPEPLLDIAATFPCGPSGFNQKKFIKAVKDQVNPKKRREKAN